MEVAVMSLSAREQHALGGIEDGLARSDPKLAAMLATFTRLTSGEEMPAGEEVTAVRPDTRGLRRLFRWPGVRYTVPLLWMLIAIAVIAFAVAASRGGGRIGCLKSWTVACVSPVPAHSSGSARKTADQAPAAVRAVPAADRPTA
jgi:hypothetical protein